MQKRILNQKSNEETHFFSLVGGAVNTHFNFWSVETNLVCEFGFRITLSLGLNSKLYVNDLDLIGFLEKINNAKTSTWVPSLN
jgi:hypothetical protein